MKQHERVLNYLHQRGSITSLEASRNLGITQLPARIFKLKQLGYLVDGEMIEVSNRFGEKCRVKEYFLRSV